MAWAPRTGRRALLAPPIERAGPEKPLLFALVLGALTAMGPFAIDMYLPGLPAMAATLGAANSGVQLTLSSFLGGLIVGQLVVGPISDGLGRRPLLIAGISCFAVCSLVCALAPTLPVLIGARFAQGATGATGTVLARAILADRFTSTDLPRYVAVLAQVLSVAPIVGPIAGGAVLVVASWRMIFVALSAIGLILLLVVWRLVPESLPVERRRTGGVRTTVRTMGSLLTRRVFVGYQLVLGFSGATLFAYVSGSSFVFEDRLGVAPTAYSLIFAVNAAGMLGSGFMFGRLSVRWRLNTLLTWGVGLAALGTLLQVLLIMTLGDTIAGAWVSLFLVVAGVALVVPSVISIGQTIARDAAGAGAGLLGVPQFLLGAAVAPTVELFGDGSSLPMALVMLIAVTCSGCALLGLARPWEGHGEPAR